MGKPKLYGLPQTAPKTGNRLDRAWQRRLQKQRNRERAERPMVAAQIAKEKEAPGA